MKRLKIYHTSVLLILSACAPIQSSQIEAMSTIERKTYLEAKETKNLCNAYTNPYVGAETKEQLQDILSGRGVTECDGKFGNFSYVGEAPIRGYNQIVTDKNGDPKPAEPYQSLSDIKFSRCLDDKKCNEDFLETYGRWKAECSVSTVPAEYSRSGSDEKYNSCVIYNNIEHEVRFNLTAYDLKHKIISYDTYYADADVCGFSSAKIVIDGKRYDLRTISKPPQIFEYYTANGLLTALMTGKEARFTEGGVWPDCLGDVHEVSLTGFAQAYEKAVNELTAMK